MRALMGSFHLLPLPELVALLGQRQASGELACERGSVKKCVHLSGGVAVGAASNDPREYLGQLLINFGHLDEEQLAKGFQTQQETKVKLGKVLTMVGLVEPAVVRDTLAIKIRETLLDVFVWDSGYFTFDEGPAPETDDLDVAVALGDIAREAEFRTTVWEAFRAAFPSGADTLAVDEAADQGIAPGSVEARLVQLAREGKSIDEIGLALHATDFHLYQRLYALHRKNVVAAVPAVGPPEETDEAAQAADLLRDARAALADGRLGEAEGLAARAVEAEPGLPEAAPLLAEARRALGERLRAFLPRVPVLKVAPHEIGRLRLTSAEKYLLARCDGARDVAQLVRIAPLSELEVLKAVQRFVEGRIAEVR